MNFFAILKKKSKFFYVFVLCLGLINSFVYSGILLIINSTITQTPLPYFESYSWQVYILIILVSLFSNRIFRTYMVYLTNDILFEFETSVLDRLRNASFPSFKKIGIERVYTALGDTGTLGTVPEMFIEAINSGVILVCALIYLFYVSAVGAASILLLMAFLLVVYLMRNKRIEATLNIMRDLRDDYFRYLQDLLLGFKEIKMSKRRNTNIFHQFIKPNLSKSRDLGVETAIKYTDNELIGSYSWYVVIGFIIFLLPVMVGLDTAGISVFVVTILFLMRPVAMLVGLLPLYNGVKIAIERLQRFSTELENQKPDIETDAVKQELSFDQLKFQDIQFSYTNEKTHKEFILGPLNLDINKGEIIFITGGNGSGKSTFINILTGLYKPHSGDIFVDDSLIYTYFREHIAAIFTDNYLFSENYDEFTITETNEKLANYSHLMKLENILKIVQEKKLFDHNLSQGQKKRLSLIYALLENRPILVLDEWAAEQDPKFRAYFYHSILPKLKEMGKTVIAVTHDDRYFSCADRVIEFEYGKIIVDKTNVIVPATNI